MANRGFSAAVNYFGTIAGLTVKSSSDGASSQFAECQDSYGDTVATDVYGAVIAPSAEYSVTGQVDLSQIALGTVFAVGDKKVMLTEVSISTSANSVPTVSMSGVEVEPGATTKRTYACFGTLKPRSRAQDVASALGVSTAYTSISINFAIDSQVETIVGNPVASDCAHGRVEVSVTMSDGTGDEEITAAEGWQISSAESSSHPDAGYIERTATLWKAIAGTEAA